MRHLLRQPHNAPSGYVALMVFLMAYIASMALVIAPDHVKSAMDTSISLAVR